MCLDAVLDVQTGAVPDAGSTWTLALPALSALPLAGRALRRAAC